jgi:hypothetical protein
MKLSEFVKKYNNKNLERFDPNAKNQCVDLFLGYLDEVLGLASIIPIGIINAYDIYNKTHKFTPHSTKIKNTPDAVPQYGDVIVWSSGYGPSGHVAVYLSGDVNKFKAFSQNDPVGAKCIEKEYTYKNVLGWLRPNSMPKEETELEACLTAHGSCMTALSKAEEKIKMLESELFSCNVNKNSMQETYTKLEKLYETLKLDLQKTKGEYEMLHGEYEIAKSNASSLEKELLIVNEKLSTALQSPDSSVLQAAHDEIARLEDLLDKQYIKKAKHKWLQIVQEMAYELGTKL